MKKRLMRMLRTGVSLALAASLTFAACAETMVDSYPANDFADELQLNADFADEFTVISDFTAPDPAPSDSEIQEDFVPELPALAPAPEEDSDFLDDTALDNILNFSYRRILVNPVYENVLTEADVASMVQDIQPDNHSIMPAAAVPSFSSGTEAGISYRTQLKQHTNPIMIAYKVPLSTSDMNAALNDLIDQTIAIGEGHNGVPDEGDYLAYHNGGCSVAMNDGYVEGSNYICVMSFMIPYFTTLEEEAAVTQKINSLKTSLNISSKSTVDKIDAIYDYITSHVTYDYDHLSTPTYYHQYTTYAALIEGTSVCQGYSSLLYRLLLEFGIDNRMIPSVDEGNHIFNIIKIGSYYYFADATWDAGLYPYRYYYLKCEDHFVYGDSGHVRHADFNTAAFNAAHPISDICFAERPPVTETPTPTPKPTATNTPTPKPTATNTPTPKPTATNTPTPKPTATNTPTPKPTATNTPTPLPTATDTPTPTPTPVTLAAPVLSGVSNVGNGVKVTWNAVDGATKYRVFRKTSGTSWTKIADTAKTAYTDSTAAGNKTYIYTVRCLSADGKSYASSYDAKGKTITYLPVPALTKVTNVSGGTEFIWKSVAGAEGYKVYRKTDGGWKLLNTTTALKWKDTSVTGGTTYTYTVRAYKGSYVSYYDTTGVKTTYLPDTKVTALDNTATGIKVTWNAAACAKGYYVYRKYGSNSYTKIATITSGKTTTYADNATLTNGTAYTYAVRAYNGSYSGTYTAATKVRVIRPTIKTLKNGSAGAVTVTWEKNTKATGYQVMYKLGTTSKTYTISNNTSQTYTIKSLSKGKTYSIYVRTYCSYNGKNYYSCWSPAKSITLTK